jgi:hypothetical protein
MYNNRKEKKSKIDTYTNIDSLTDEEERTFDHLSDNSEDHH